MPNIVEILVTAKNLARPALDEATANARGLGGVMGKMAVVSGAALAGIAVGSVKMAADFQSATTRLITSAGESEKNIDSVRKGMLDMASQVGYSATELAKGMYTVESAGYHGADGLKVLKAAAQGAKDENADLGTVANAVTDALTDYHLKASDSADVTSQLVKAVSFGKTTFEEFSGSMSTVLPLAGTLHIKLADVTGVMATMTAHGVSAAQASQNIANAMRHLASPSGTMEKEFSKLGITTKEVTQRLSKQGLQGTMEFLSQTAEKAGKIGTPEYTAALAKLMGSAAGLNVALQTTGENSKQAQTAIKGIAGASADAKGNVEGFSEVQKTMKQRVDELKAGFDSLMIEIGDKLLPVVSSMVNFFVKHQTVTEVLVGSIIALTAALAGYALVMKTVEVATAAWEAIQAVLDAELWANPIGVVVLAIVALVAIIVEAYKHSETFRSIVQAVFKGVEMVVKASVKAIVAVIKTIVSVSKSVGHGIEAAWNAISGFFKKWWPLLLAIFAPPIAILIAIWNHFHNQIASVAHSVWNGIKGFLSGVWHGIESAASAVWNAIKAAIIRPIQAVWSAISPLASRIGNALSSAFQHAWSVVSGIASKFYSVGHDIVMGIVHGVENAGGALFGALKSLASSALSSAKSFLGISSPSKLFSQEVGNWIPEGIAHGVNKSAHVAVKAVTNTVKSVASTATAPSTVTAARSAGHSTSGPAVVQLEWVGGQGGDELLKWIRKSIKIKGGNVQTVLGSA